MIKIEIQRQKDKIIYFEIKGHANFSEYGEDIICSAVSSAGQKTRNGLIETLNFHKKLKFIEEDRQKINNKKKSKLTNDELEKEDILVESMYSYLKEVAKNYIDFVKLKEKNLDL